MEIPQIKIRNTKLRIDLLILSAIILIFIISTTATLKNYGPSWDEGLGNLFFGERYFSYFTKHQEKYLDFKADIFNGVKEFNLFNSPSRFYPFAFPALADTVSSGFVFVLAEKLQIMDPVDAFHFPKILLSGVFFVAFYFFVKKELNWQIALAATFLLAFYPRFWGDVHFNPKDIPLLVFFSLAIFTYAKWLKKRSWKNAFLVGLAGGVAVAMKANAFFLPFVLIFGLWDIKKGLKQIKGNFRVVLHELLQHAFMGLVALIIFVGSWPYLYVGKSPIDGILSYIKFITSQGGRLGPMKFQVAPLLQVLSSMPEIMLLLLIVGIIISLNRVFKQANSIYRLILLWFIVPIFRVSLPGMVNFDGIRHFIEFLPAACILSGSGLWQLGVWVKQFIPKYSKLIYAGACFLVVVNTSCALISTNPYQYIYYNQFIGGIPGARAKFGDNEVSDYWGISYRKGMEWLNDNAEPNAAVIVPVAGWLVELTGQIWWRDDINYCDVNSKAELESIDKPTYVIVLHRPSFYDEVALLVMDHYEVVFQETLSDLALMTIYKK